jgi:putative transcriptional regulator
MTLPESGNFLIADPFLLDNYFSRSVIYLCEHDDELGSIGFVINRLLPDKLEDFFPDLNNAAIPIYYGGPVHTDRLNFLHSLGDKIEGGVEISDGIFWGGNFNRIKEMIDEKNIDLNCIKFFLGYSGWEKQQLNAELKSSTWIVGEAKQELLFEEKEENIWRQALIQLGGNFAQMSNYPIHPSLN